LESLNIICLIPGINAKSLGINQIPSVSPQSYEESLWFNCLQHLSHSNYFNSIKNLTRSVSEEHSQRLIEFMNNMLALK
jgi:hypothetical protein